MAKVFAVMPTLEGEALTAETSRLTAMAVKQLNVIARRNRVEVHGTKAQLIARLTGQAQPTPAVVMKAASRNFPALTAYVMPGDGASREELTAGFDLELASYTAQLQAVRDWSVAYHKAHSRLLCRDGLNRFLRDYGMPPYYTRNDYGYSRHNTDVVSVASEALPLPAEDLTDAGLRRQLRQRVERHAGTMDQIREYAIQRVGNFASVDDLNEGFRAAGIEEYYVPQRGNIGAAVSWEYPRDEELSDADITRVKAAFRESLDAVLGNLIPEGAKGIKRDITITIRK